MSHPYRCPYNRDKPKQDAKMVKIAIMVAVGILLAVGGIMWTNAANSLYSHLPEVIVEDDFSLTVLPGEGMGDSRHILFPAIMGIIGGVVWIICGIKFADVSFPGAICMTIGIMLITIGILNFLAGFLGFSGFLADYMKEAQYPSPLLHYLFLYHRKTSIFIFAAAALILIFIGKALDEGA
jgi:hypothetical protein